MITAAVLRLCASSFIVLLTAAASASAQSMPLQFAQQSNVPPEHEHPVPAPPQHEHPQPTLDAGAPHEHQHAGPSLFSPLDASGTAWLPYVTPMYGFHGQLAGWEIMLHGNLFLQLLHEHAPEHRGATQTGGINWVMAMARRELGGGRIGLRGVMSLEPWTHLRMRLPELAGDRRVLRWRHDS